MIEMQPAVVLLLVEALAVLALVLMVSLTMALLRRRREARAVAALVASVGGEASARNERNGAAIRAALGADGEALASRVKEVENANRLLLQRVVVGWSRRDAKSIQTLPDALEALNVQWRELLGMAGASGSPAGRVEDSALQAHAAAMANLSAEHKAVQDELAITRETMTRMLNEYAAMYQRGDQTGDSTARRLLSAQGEDDVAGRSATSSAETPAGVSTPVASTGPASEIKPARRPSAPPAATEDDDDAGEVTEDDLDALFDAQPHQQTTQAPAAPPPDTMIGDLDIEDPFAGLEGETPAEQEPPVESNTRPPTRAAAS